MMKQMILLVTILGVLCMSKLLANSPQTKSFNLTPSSPNDSWTPTVGPGESATLTVTIAQSGSYDGHDYKLANSNFPGGSGFWTGPNGSGLSRSYIGTNPNGDEGSSTVAVTCTWNPVPPKMAGGTNAAPATLPPPINGSGTATINASSVSITWHITPSSGFKKADGEELFTYTVNAKDQSGQPVNVTFNSVSADNATPSDPGWNISGGTGSNTDETTGTVKSETGSVGKLKVSYTCNNQPFADTASQELRFYKIKVDIYESGDTSSPSDGLVVLKNTMLTIEASDVPANQWALENSELEWFVCKRKNDGSWTSWEKIQTTTTGPKFDFSAATSGIFKLKAVVSDGTEYEFLRKISETGYGPGLVNQPNAFGVCDTQEQIDLRNITKVYYGSTAYPLHGTVSSQYGFSSFGSGDFKCNIFVAHRGMEANLDVPKINFSVVPVVGTRIYHYPPVANQWAGTDDTDHDTPGLQTIISRWAFMPTTTDPQPGYIIAAPNSFGPGHVGIIDYDGEGIGAGTSGTVNKLYPFHNPPTGASSRYRRYVP